MNVPLLSSVSAIAVVGYFGVAMLHGNLKPLLQQMGKDWQFLEWATALGILYYLSKKEYLSGPVTALIGIAAVGVLLKVTSGAGGSGVVTALTNTQGSLLENFSTAAVQAGKALGIQTTATYNWDPTRQQPAGPLPGHTG